ncbi:DNA topoisomerase [Pseudomonas syringae pv. actinidiae]|nr:DNA topoisomerase [Pseudomonas syringae pv. actinidiae]
MSNELVLLIVEKSSVAKTMADAFGWSKIPGGFEGKFEGKKIVCVPLRGHVIAYDEPKNVMPGISWESMDNLVPIPRHVPKVRIQDDPNDRAPISMYYNNVQRNIKIASEVILGTDCDAEGEYIGWELIEHFNFKGRVRRAWLAGGTDVASMKSVMANLKEGHVHKGMAYAAEAKSFSDYIYQILTRAYTYYARRGKFGQHLGSGGGRQSVMSIGRVQTSVVGMIVEREREIQNFVSVDHFVISSDFTIPADPGYAITAKYKPEFERGSSDKDIPGIAWNIDFDKDGEVIEKPLFTGKREIQAFEARLKSAADRATVVEYSEGKETKHPPKTYNTSEAMLDIAKACGVSASVGQHIIEDLYEQGYVSYPRTTKSELPVSIYKVDRNSLFDAVKGISELGEQASFVQNLHNGQSGDYKAFMPKVYKEGDMPHFGLVPSPTVMSDSKLASLRANKKDEKQQIPHTGQMMAMAYKIIVKRFIETHYPPAIFATQTIKFKVPVEDLFGNKESFFQATGRRVVDAGFRNAFSTKDGRDTIMKPLKQGQPAHFAKINLSENRTEPPKRYTKDDLAIHMEKIALQIKDPKWRKILKDSEGIGTPATRKNIIQTLMTREYIDLKKDNYYPTPKGCDLYDKAEEWMVRPEYTAMWEDRLRQMYTIQNEGENIRIRDAFIEENITKLEKVIEDLIERFGRSVEYSADRKGPQVLSPKMIAAIKKIHEMRKIPVPKELLKDPAAASAFLDKAIAEIKKKREEQGDKPSDAQLELAKKLSERLNGVFPASDDVFADRTACSAYIDKAMKMAPPSAAQLNLAQKIYDGMPEDKRPDPVLFELAETCSAFISKNMKKKTDGASKPGSSKGAVKAKAPPKRTAKA